MNRILRALTIDHIIQAILGVCARASLAAFALQEVNAPDRDAARDRPQYLTVFVLATSGFVAARSLLRLAHARRLENVVSLIGRVETHNWHIVADKERCASVAGMEQLSVPESEADRTLYWNARLVHLSHVNFVWQAWELGGTPHEGHLPSHMDGWDRFARRLSADLRTSAARTPRTPCDVAAADLLLGMDIYEIMPTRFVKWFKSLS